MTATQMFAKRSPLALFSEQPTLCPQHPWRRWRGPSAEREARGPEARSAGGWPEGPARSAHACPYCVTNPTAMMLSKNPRSGHSLYFAPMGRVRFSCL